MKRESVMLDVERGSVIASSPEVRMETTPEEREVDSDSTVCVPPTSSIEMDSNVDA